MNNMYEYLLNKNTAMHKHASAPMVPAYSRNVYNVLRKIAEDPIPGPGDEEEITKAMNHADSGLIPHYYYLDENNNFDPSVINALKRLAVDSGRSALDWTKKHGEDLGYIGGGLGIGAGAGALLTPKNRILGALLGGVLGAGGGYGTKRLVDKYYPTVKDKVSALFKKDTKAGK